MPTHPLAGDRARMELKGPAAYISEFAAAFLYRTVMELGERPLPARSPVRGEFAAPPLTAAT